MNLSELQTKEVISVLDGKKLGRIVDASADMQNGKINYFVCEQRKFFKRLFSSNNEVTFTLENIEKIGSDVILVKIG